MAQRTKDKRFKKDYTRKDILNYLKGVQKILGRSPSSRDLSKFPGPAPRTIIRRFNSWSKALKEAGMRPQTHQLKSGEHSFIRMHWRKMTDKEIAEKLGVTEIVIKYYRMNYNLWKNRKGTAKSTYRKEALKIYGQKCEVCGLTICEWHHIIPKSTKSNDWSILCPTCHAVITRKLVIVSSRDELKTKLLPYMRKLYSELELKLDVAEH
ncbi:MAG: hypothetical protein Q7R49_04880 [Candidatus Daviesbacteria bacterium]|nr:hypothetical protein [Candidatus Daviesbacteria bacterium]